MTHTLWMLAGIAGLIFCCILIGIDIRDELRIIAKILRKRS